MAKSPKKRGPRPRPAKELRSRVLKVRMTEAQYRALRALAEEQGRSMANLLVWSTLRPDSNSS